MYTILTTDLEWINLSGAQLALTLEIMGISEFKKQTIAVMKND